MMWLRTHIWIFLKVMWSAWGAFGACSVTCGNGTKERTRECLDPYTTGGNCTGSSFETTSCNDATCGTGTGMYPYFTKNSNLTHHLSVTKIMHAIEKKKKKKKKEKKRKEKKKKKKEMMMMKKIMKKKKKWWWCIPTSRKIQLWPTTYLLQNNACDWKEEK